MLRAGALQLQAFWRIGLDAQGPPALAAGGGPGLKKPLGTGPVTAVTGLAGPARFRIRAVRNRAKFKF